MPGDTCLTTHCHKLEDFNFVTVAGTHSCLCY